MADLTANASIRILGQEFSEEWLLDSSSAQTVYKGEPMILDISVDTVNVRHFVDGVTVAADDIFMGIAAEGPIVVASGDTENVTVKMWVWPTIVGFKSTVFTKADVGDPVYMSTSSTLSATIGDNPVIGKLHDVRDGYCFVQISSPTICSGA